jgi:alpha-tubulin suppressor-like RCC1 family protein
MTRQLASGGFHTCARIDDGTVRCWGRNGEGQLGVGDMEASLTALAVVGLRDVEEIAAGGAHNCARLRSGAVRCWGGNGDGQLGDGTLVPRSSTVAVVW